MARSQIPGSTFFRTLSADEVVSGVGGKRWQPPSISGQTGDCSPVMVACSSLIRFSAQELFDLACRRCVGRRIIADDLGTKPGVGRQLGNIETVARFRINARLKRGARWQLRKNPLADLRRCDFVLGAHQAQCRHLGLPWLKVSAIGVIGDDGQQWTVLCRGQLTERREPCAAPERPVHRGNLRSLT